MNQLKFGFRNLRKTNRSIFILVDIVMILLVIFNITWIVFDTLFVSDLFQDALASLLPRFTNFYADNIHPNFPTYDMMFVAVFLTEFFIRWAVAIYHKAYYRWFFYPFVHWYDILGCIPIGSMRWLRLLRVVAVLYRLNKYQVYDFSSTYPMRVIKKYLKIIVEEVSDRVVINVLNGVEKEIHKGHPVVGRIANEVLLPQREVVSQWVTQKINDLKASVYEPRREEFKKYVDLNIRESMSKATNIKLMSKIPVVGPIMDTMLDDIVSDVVFNVSDKLVTDLGSENTDELVEQLTDQIMLQLSQPSQETNQAGREVLIKAIQIIKEEVSIQQWKLEEKAQKAGL